MILSKFSYKEQSGWQIEDLMLHTQNLIVGLNAVGKSRTLSAIGKVASFIRGDIPSHLGDFSCALVFSNGTELRYSFTIEDGTIGEEKLFKGDETLISRTKKHAILYRDDKVSPPDNKLLIQVRRDVKNYPEIEEIVQWAENTSLFVFSNITTSPDSLSPYAISNEPLLPEMYSKISKEQKDLLIKYMCDLEYKVNHIGNFVQQSGHKMLYIHETGLKRPIPWFSLSNGMFRVFCVLLYMIYSSTLSNARCLLIDDLGEGLDYMRSTKLGDIIFDYCSRKKIQLIVTSNDSFLMDRIDLQYWNILRRKEMVVTSMNIENNRELFQKFSRTGLSNFDIIFSNFIANNTLDE